MLLARSLYWLNLLFSVLIGIYAIYVFYHFLNPAPEDSHGGMLALYVSGTLAVLSLGFLLASVAHGKSWRIRWALQALPVSGLAFLLLT